MGIKKARKLSTVIGTYFIVSVIFLGGMIGCWTYYSAKKNITMELKRSFEHRYEIAENIVEREVDRLEHILHEVVLNRHLFTEIMGSQDSVAQKIFKDYIDRSERYRSDVLFISKFHNSVFVDASSPVPNVQPILGKVAAKSRLLLSKARLIRFKSNGADLTGIFKSRKIVLDSGEVFGILVAGTILNDNLLFLNQIKQKTKSSAVILVENMDVVASTLNRASAAKYKDFADHPVHGGLHLMNGFNGNSRSEQIICHHPINLLGEATSLDILFFMDNDVLVNLKRSYLKSLSIISTVFVIFLFVIFVVIRRLVYPSIESMLNYTQEISRKSDSDMSLEPGSIAELNTIGAAMEKMVASIGKTQSELRASEERYRLMAENVADVIWTMDMNLNFTYISPSVYPQQGYTVEEVMGQSIKESLLPDSLEKVVCLFAEKISLIESGDQEGFSPVEFELEQLCKDGTAIWSSNNVRILQGKDGQPDGILGVTHDISRQKLAEKEKIKAQNIAAEQKKLTLVGRIAGKMAHDFNNVLGVIMGNSELAFLECRETETKKMLELIFDQTVRGKNLTKNLVAFAKDQELKQGFFRISEKIDLVIKLMKKDIGAIEIIRKYGPDVPELLADTGMIEHALINLIQNSIHALSLVESPKIIIRTYSLDDKICFDIEDNGCGIPDAHLESIYDPAFTLKGGNDVTGLYKSGIKGTGYGMSNIKKYIELHKGSIAVESEIGSGTIFTITLPVVYKELTVEEKREICESKPHTDKYILLVEDEPAISKIQYRVLTREPCHHKVDVADNGQAAMDLFDRNEYDLVSLDYILPGKINGMNVYDHIRKTDKTIPILFISGNIEFLESLKELRHNDRYFDHLSKPCRNKDYVTNINELLDGIRAPG